MQNWIFGLIMPLQPESMRMTCDESMNALRIKHEYLAVIRSNIDSIN